MTIIMTSKEQQQKITSVGENVETSKPLYIADGNLKW
jgi:hypothetical protein